MNKQKTEAERLAIVDAWEKDQATKDARDMDKQDKKYNHFIILVVAFWIVALALIVIYVHDDSTSANENPCTYGVDCN